MSDESLTRGRSLSNSQAETGLAPTCPPLVSTAPLPAVKPPEVLEPGQRIDDFEIVSMLGRGAFGVVYLARQISLGRQVALKVTVWQESEGRKMAQLEHEHIVQVFSETVDLAGIRRLLCMQYVPGPTLQQVLQRLSTTEPADWSGATLLAIVDRLTVQPASFDPASLRNRELLCDFDWPTTVCWIGARLAEALDYAHSHGVMHRDIKPGNIMLSQYGRPMLVDFNVAFQPLTAGVESQSMGGTLAYMAPEHLDAFAGEASARPETVAEPADLYSLGVVLFQMLAGHLPFDTQPKGKNRQQLLCEMAAERRGALPALPPEYPRVLDQVVARCLAADPRQRFSSGRELAAALEGCRQFHETQQAMPAEHRFRRMVKRHPLVWMLVLALVPHVVATVINITYNQIRIISHLTEEQETVFIRLILGYDTIAYGLGVGLGLRVVLPVYRALSPSRLRFRDSFVKSHDLAAARRLMLSWPLWAAALACLGWLPGGVIFPLTLRLYSGSLPWPECLHLVISFTISGLIALTYSMLCVQWIVLCVLYSRLWNDVRDFRATATAELSPIQSRLRLLQVLSGLIPLAGAVLMTAIGPQEFTAREYQSFRFLVSGLIALGMAGFQLAMLATGRLSEAQAAFTSPRRHASIVGVQGLKNAPGDNSAAA